MELGCSEQRGKDELFEVKISLTTKLIVKDSRGGGRRLPALLFPSGGVP